jgi:hypothetical protein
MHYKPKILLTTERYESIVDALSITEQVLRMKENATAI